MSKIAEAHRVIQALLNRAAEGDEAAQAELVEMGWSEEDIVATVVGLPIHEVSPAEACAYYGHVRFHPAKENLPNSGCHRCGHTL